MNSLRVARVALRARPSAMRVASQRRGYAEAVPDKVRDVPEPRIQEACNLYIAN